MCFHHLTFRHLEEVNEEGYTIISYIQYNPTTIYNPNPISVGSDIQSFLFSTGNLSHRPSKLNIPFVTSNNKKDLHMRSKQSLNVCYLNLRSVRNKVLSLNDYMVDQDIDLFALTKTWLEPCDNDGSLIEELSLVLVIDFSRIPGLQVMMVALVYCLKRASE